MSMKTKSQKNSMTKKDIAISFLELASAGQVRAAFEKHIHQDFIHHLVFFKGNRQTFLKAMEDNSREFSHKTYQTIHALEDGDLVAIHGKVTLDLKIFGVIHIFRFEDDKIIESWEASQEALNDSPNENGLF
jgi:predicted SnoaL-like aldol condensation-catalyzing enzyme